MTAFSRAHCPSRLSAVFKSTPQRSHRALYVRPQASSGKVEELIKRDKKNVEVVDPSVFESRVPASSNPSPAPTTAAPSTSVVQEPAQEVSLTQKQKDAQKRSEGPQRCREAIDLGLQMFQAGEYQAAVELFELALELPGSGVMRISGSVREYSCPSDGEEQAALYNMACAYAKMGQRAPALTCLEGLLESGFEDYAGIRADPDLAPLRGPELHQLLAKYDNLVAKVLGRKKEEVPTKKPWFLW